MEKNIPIFDLDDTLFCEHEYVRSGFNAVAKYVVGKFPNLNQETLYNSFIKEWMISGRGRVFNAVCQRYNIDVSIDKLINVYRNHRPLIDLYNDAKSLISFLKRQNIPIGIITDGNSIMQWRKIEALGLNELVSSIIVSDDLGSSCWKPSDIPYKEVSKVLNTSLNECIYIGDNPHKDFVTAKRLGMKTIRIIRPVGDHMKISLDKHYEADKKIYSLLELRKDFGGGE
ncbi:HAD family hydrolase [Evansella cellulosilytica]|uniref:Haloacid dehalogenase domain protein hydrolase n=1 Tax=Evansella cellulosilytica (strain ATCC 21833 / DSM 2522 / FERM P-1141 / JCM 9156 / N-4) TaxID=649639 RepID=E6TS81_EVAC2|nr:HAD-IA family hydrolase [Evansella cellulosilytica]ADU31850.1 Haloacid dehalogenase domain protein hydrolase [Evansella cellulosilytica DSM 2522]